MSLTQFELTERVVLVTGGSKGIGKALAMGFADAGAKVAVVSRQLAACEAVVDAIKQRGGQAFALSADVGKMQDAERTINSIIDTYGRLDVLVNNAGVNSVREALLVTEDEWSRVIDINLKAVFFWAQAAAKSMAQQHRGKIINVASVGGVIGESKMAAYAASKAGVISITKSLAREWARHGILVNSLAPGYVRTEMNDEAFEDEKMYKSIVSSVPLRRIGEVGDLVGPAIFLASDASNFITGHTLFVDGGRLTGVRG